MSGGKINSSCVTEIDSLADTRTKNVSVSVLEKMSIHFLVDEKQLESTEKMNVGNFDQQFEATKKMKNGCSERQLESMEKMTVGHFGQQLEVTKKMKV